MQRRRPIGITIAAISYIIFGIVGIGWGLAYFSLKQILAPGPLFPGKVLVPLWQVSGVLIVGLGLFLFITAYALLKGKRWAYDLVFGTSLLAAMTPIIYIIGLQVNNLYYNIYTVAIALLVSVPNGIIFAYANARKNVYEFFKQAPTKKKPASEEGLRPIGVTFFAILIILGGIGGVVGGPLYINRGRILAQVLGPTGQSLYLMFELWGALLIAVGLVSFVLAYGLLKGKRWGYWLLFIFNLVGILFGFIGINFLRELDGVGATLVATIMFNLILVLYSSRPSVEKFFGVGKYKGIGKMSKAQRKGVLSDLEDMLRAGATEAEIEEQLGVTKAELEKIRPEIQETPKAQKANKPMPEEEQSPQPQQEYIKRQDVIDKEVFDQKGRRLGSVSDVAFTPSGKMGLIVSKPDKSEEVIPTDNISSVRDIIVLRAAATLEAPKTKPTIPTPAQKICSHCNHPNKPESRFCIKCGLRLPSTEVTSRSHGEG